MREIATISATDDVATVSLVGVDDDGRRSQIVRAAAAVLGRQGYAETSLKDVAREAGVAPGLLHYYFESKEELLLEVVTVTERQMVANWKAVVEAVDDPLERIVTGLDHAEARCAEQPEFFRLLLDLYTVSLSSPALRTSAARGSAPTSSTRSRSNSVKCWVASPRTRWSRPESWPAPSSAPSMESRYRASWSSRRRAAPFRALKVLLLSLVVTAYVTAGQDPPIARLGEMLSRHP